MDRINLNAKWGTAIVFTNMDFSCFFFLKSLQQKVVAKNSEAEFATERF